MFNRIRKHSERGQAIILIVFAIVGLVAIVGLMVDGGIALVEYARLKRGIDAASIAAADQFRKNYNSADMETAGREFLMFNQSDADVTIFTCSCPPDDPTNCADHGWNLDESLCAPEGQPQRKLVRITASRRVDFGFMRVVGIDHTTISASAIGEAASVDMVLSIDTSTSMAYETTGGPNADAATPGVSPGDDPEVCNAHMDDPTQRCEPLGQVIDAAIAFVDELFFPYDRVALVASTGQTLGSASREPVTVLHLSDNLDTSTDPPTPTTEVEDAIRGLKVYQPQRCPYPFVDPNMVDDVNGDGDPNDTDHYLDLLRASGVGICLRYEPHFLTQVCIPRLIGNSLGELDSTTCGPSNIGGGLYNAGYEFANARQDSFWVVISLFGGPANASNPSGYTDGLCPEATWSLPSGSGFCRDEDDMSSVGWTVPGTWNAAAATAAQNFDWSTYDPDDATRHHFTVDNSDPDNPVVVYPAAYDADDFARDGADYVAAAPPDGQGATLFSICMGNYCRAYPNRKDPASGELLGYYMALHAGGPGANHGLYFYAEDASVVGDVFMEIAENIQTRISQ